MYEIKNTVCKHKQFKFQILNNTSSKASLRIFNILYAMHFLYILLYIERIFLFCGFQKRFFF